MSVGAIDFFQWCDRASAHAEITYMPSCGELEIRVSILGEGDWYCKRAGSFACALDYVRKHYASKGFVHE